MKHAKTLIIADDITGANASGILLKKIGLNVYNLLTSKFDSINSDVIAIATNTRACEQAIAYNVVSSILQGTKNISFSLYNKRIDSTLRGNLGIELQAFIDHFNYKKKAVIVASFPDSNRTCSAGKLYVNGVLLEETELAQDTKTPKITSIVKELFEVGNNLKYDSIYLSSLYQNKENFQEELLLKLENADAIIIDAITNEDIDFIAKHVVSTNIDFIAVDPGPFTQRVTYHQKQIERQKKINLYMVGSVVNTTIMQLHYINNLSDYQLIYVDAKKLVYGQYENYFISLIKKIDLNLNHNIVFTTTNLIDIHRIDLEAEAIKQQNDLETISQLINTGLAKLALQVIEYYEFNINCVYTSGGDISTALLSAAAANGLDLINEIIPLCVHTKIKGGVLNDLDLITKGGAIGSANTIDLIKKYMEDL